MPLNIKNREVEQLAAEVARMTGETKTEAVRQALAERKARLGLRIDSSDRLGRVQRFLQREVWPLVPAGERGRRLSVEEEDAVLGFGPHGA